MSSSVSISSDELIVDDIYVEDPTDDDSSVDISVDISVDMSDE
jgi:hypothetical protein